MVWAELDVEGAGEVDAEVDCEGEADGAGVGWSWVAATTPTMIMITIMMAAAMYQPVLLPFAGLDCVVINFASNKMLYGKTLCQT